jgi:hypothetical protein
LCARCHFFNLIEMYTLLCHLFVPFYTKLSSL